MSLEPITPKDAPALRTPCANCPWRRDVKPGALGGSPATTYLGQAYAGMWLPCHTDYKEGMGAKQQTPATCRQCAGAAIFRNNAGWAQRMPDFILSLPRDTGRIFPTPEHFLAHHMMVTLKEAESLLRFAPLHVLAMSEVRKAKTMLVERSIPTNNPNE